jgi:hypothetical protein
MVGEDADERACVVILEHRRVIVTQRHPATSYRGLMSGFVRSRLVGGRKVTREAAAFLQGGRKGGGRSRVPPCAHARCAAHAEMGIIDAGMVDVVADGSEEQRKEVEL